MLFYEGLTCPVCHKPFTPNDDIVACPVCGLPHHRDCWMKIGHCEMEAAHGTPEQWTRDNTVKQQPAPDAAPKREVGPDGTFNGRICPYCHTRNPQYAEFCAHCGHELGPVPYQEEQPRQVNEYTPFQSPFSNTPFVSANEKFGKANARDVAAIVGSNAAYYIPRFRQIEKTGKGGWNWAAFLLYPFWLFYRKQYAVGSILLVLQMFENVFTSILFGPMLSGSGPITPETMDAVMHSPYFLPIFILSGILFAVQIIIGFRANNLYLRHCEKKIETVRKDIPDISSAELATKGGTSMAAAIFSYFAPVLVTNLLSLMLYFIK